MTLRSRLTWILLATLLPLGLAVGLGLYAFVKVSLYARLDDALSARAEALAAAVKWHNGTLEFDFEDAAMPQYQAQANVNSKQAAYFEMWRIQEGELGSLIQRSKSMGSAVLVDPRRLVHLTARDFIWNADLADGTDVRVLAMRVAPATEREDQGSDTRAANTEAGSAVPNGGTASAVRNSDGIPEVLIAVAVPRGAVDRPLEILAIGLVLAGSVLAVAGLLSIRWAITKGLAPVSDLAAQVGSVDAEILGMRLAVPRLPPEIAPIQDRVNALMVRMEGAMQREKRFTSAAAHELRTPIAELRMLLEVAASRERTSQQWSQTAERALGVLVRAQSLCEALLRLSRAGADRIANDALAESDIQPVIVERVESALAMQGADPSRVRIECKPGFFAVVDTALLGSIVGNLLDNAIRHGSATPGDPILIRGSRTQNYILIEINNPAPGITQEDVAHLFEPFWRKNLSRHDQSGFGLGLAVARTLARAMGGDLTALCNPENKVGLQLRLRAASAHLAPTP